jgi:hypothetical protein
LSSSVELILIFLTLLVLVQAPWLVLDDGRVLTQSLAINLYCAKLAGYLPSDQLLVARTIELDGCISDVRVLSPSFDTWIFMFFIQPSSRLSSEEVPSTEKLRPANITYL